jgi:uncharacterized membrane protein YdjX (TVP38/TMEM64 family)
MRIFLVFLILALLFGVPFLIWGDVFESRFAGDEAVEWLRAYGALAWAVAVLFLMADLVLPIPATLIMAALGILYGPWWGGLIGTAGSVLSGLLAYQICLMLGRGAARRIAGDRDLLRTEAFFARSGGWAVVLSRWLPLLPEVVACMAGLARMPFPRFAIALVCGSLPMAFVYALLGHLGSDRPLLALLVSAALPLMLWVCVRPVFGKKQG